MIKTIRTLSIKILLGSLAATVVGCASGPALNSSSPEGAFKQGERFEKDDRFEEAIAQFNQVKNKFPYSKLATEAELRVAEIHFKREEFIEAQASYQTFKELHPSHPKSDYVTYRLGLSFFKQLPSGIDRDLSVAERAILYFDEVTQSFATSPYAAEAAEHKTQALKMLAEKEYYVGRFYLIREKWESALGRFEGLIERYPALGFDAPALFGASLSALKIKDIGKAKTYYQRLVNDFGDSQEAQKARRELGHRI